MNSGPEEKPRTLWGTAHVLHQVQLLLCIMLYISLCFYSESSYYSTKLLFILQVFIINFVVHNAESVFLWGKSLFFIAISASMAVLVILNLPKWKTLSSLSVSSFRSSCSLHSPSLENCPEKGPSFSRTGYNLAPVPRPLEPPCLDPGRDVEDLSGLSPVVIDTITQARAPARRRACALKWTLFANWCASWSQDPQTCFSSCRKGWQAGCLLPPWKGMWLP